MSQCCKPCEEQLHLQKPAHRILPGGKPVCNEHYEQWREGRGTIPPALDAKRVEETPSTQTLDVQEDGMLSKDQTCRTCGKTHWKIKGGICKTCAAKESAEATPRKRGRPAGSKGAASNGLYIRIPASEHTVAQAWQALSDDEKLNLAEGAWATLTLEEKVGLLNTRGAQ